MRVLAIGWLLAAAGCLDVLGPEVGAQRFDTCRGDDSDPGTEVSFARELGALMARPDVNCVRCHTPGGGNPIGIELGGLDISTYESLRSGGVNSAASIIVPGDPCASVLVQKISAAPPFGERMPRNGAPLSIADAQLVSDWIAEGARDN